MPYTPILATLGYVLSPDGRSVLLIHRNTRPEDAHYGKFNGLGGKIERDEDVVTAMKRELREEAGIEATRLWLRGTINWPGFGKHGEDWLGFIYVIREFSGEPHSANPEGALAWVPVQTLLTPGALNLWEGDPHFLPLVFSDTPRQFHGVMPYRDGKPIGWTYEWV